MVAVPYILCAVAGYCFRWLTQHLLHRIAMRSQRGSRPAFDEAFPQKEGNCLPPRKTDATTRMSTVLSAATTIDWSQYAGSTAILSLDGGETWIIRDKTGKFASVTIDGLPKMPTTNNAAND